MIKTIDIDHRPAIKQTPPKKLMDNSSTFLLGMGGILVGFLITGVLLCKLCDFFEKKKKK